MCSSYCSTHTRPLRPSLRRRRRKLCVFSTIRELPLATTRELSARAHHQHELAATATVASGRPAPQAEGSIYCARCGPDRLRQDGLCRTLTVALPFHDDTLRRTSGGCLHVRPGPTRRLR